MIAGAYAESLRVTSLRRTVALVALVDARTIKVADSIQAASPVRPAILWHADNEGVFAGALRIAIKPARGVRLVLEPYFARPRPRPSLPSDIEAHLFQENHHA